MVTESIAILIITLFILFALLRSEHADYAVSVTPLLITPIVNLIISGLIYVLPNSALPFEANVIIIFSHIFALAVACALFVLFSNKIKNANTKKVYVIVMLGYSIILSCAYIYQLIVPVG